MFVALALSLLGLVAGPLLVALGTRRLRLAEVVEDLTLGVIPVMVAGRLLPHLCDDIGVLALVLALAGYCILAWLERRQVDLASVGAAFVLPALTFHSAMDGAALAVAFGDPGDVGAVVLGGALVLHRLPEGLLIGSVFVPRVGVRRTLKSMAWLAAGTLAGAAGGRGLLARAPEAWLHGMLALGLGITVHLVIHRHTSPQTADGRRASAGAFCAGIAAALALAWLSESGSRLKFAAFGVAAALLTAVGRFYRQEPRAEPPNDSVRDRCGPVPGRSGAVLDAETPSRSLDGL